LFLGGQFLGGKVVSFQAEKTSIKGLTNFKFLKGKAMKNVIFYLLFVFLVVALFGFAFNIG
jgi:hypothetical protein